MRTPILPLAALFVVVSAAVAVPQQAPPRPLIGVNYAHSGNVGCDIEGTGILARYHLPGVRDRVRRELATMRTRGLDTLRLIVWHQHDPPAELYGIVPSNRGALPEPYRTSLAQYAADVREAGFVQLSVSFAPRVQNHAGHVAWDPGLFVENWSFIRDVRAIVKANGPASVHIDLMNEGAPGDDAAPVLEANRMLYLTQLWRSYVVAYGRDDVVISVTAGRFPLDRSKLERLIAIYEASGAGFPRWFEVHAGYEPRRALLGLRKVDELLSDHGLTQPLVIGEAPYEAPGVAAAIGTYIATTARPTLEVMQWPMTTDRPCRAVSVSAPYTGAAYRRALHGPPALELRLSPTRGVSLVRAGGEPVGRPAAGAYRVVTVDRSLVRGAWLSGPGVARRTGSRFRGVAEWMVELRAGARYRWGAGRVTAGSFAGGPVEPGAG